MLEWPNETIYRGIADVVDSHPYDAALYFEGDRIPYAELLAESEELAHGLADLGVGEGDTVAVWLSNRPEWIIAQLATSYLGAALVAVNTRYRTHELEYMMTDSACSVLVTEESFLDNQYLEMVADVVPEVREGSPATFDPDSVPSLEHVIALEADEAFPAIRAYDDVTTAGAERNDVTPATDPTAPACIFYTSGTTSDPKGCLQSNQSLLNHSYAVGEHFDLDADDVALGLLPYCGVWGYNMFMSALAHGVPQVVQTHFDAGETIENVEEYGVTYMSGLATMYERLIDADAFSEQRVATLSKGAIGFVSMGFEESVFERIEEKTGVPICQPYGLSEANSQVFVGDPDDPAELRKRVGGPMVFPAEEAAKLVDPETGEDVPPGEAGELCLRGYNVMEGYLDKPDETDEVFEDDGWFHTGDLAVRDPETDYLYYQSRMDDALRIRGFLVAPRDIEKVLDEHPGVEHSQVVGAPHPRHGQVAVAFVEPAERSLSETTLYEYLDERVADYKVPEDIEFVESFPRSEGPHGEKVQKTELRERAKGRYADA